MSFDHVLCGLRVRANVQIPGLIPCRAAHDVDVDVRFGSLPPNFTQEAPDQFLISYEDGTTFVVSRSGTQVWAVWPRPLTLEDTSTYFLGPVLGLLLRLRDVVCLHASAIVARGRAVAFLGRGGAGKSTAAAAFGKRGFPVLSDDIVALKQVGDEFDVIPAYAQLKLWPDSTKLLFESSDSLPRITPTHPTWDKRYLAHGTDGFVFAEKRAPLAAVYVLEGRSEDSRAPYVRDLTPRARWSALAANTYGDTQLGVSSQAQAHGLLVRIASTIHVRGVVPHADPARLPELCDAVLTDLSRLEGVRTIAAAS